MLTNHAQSSKHAEVAARRRQLSLAPRTYYGTLVLAIAIGAMISTTDLRYSKPWLAAPVVCVLAWIGSAAWFASAVWRAAPNLGSAVFWAVGTFAGGPIFAMVFSAKADIAIDKLEKSYG
jgi:uncharacterized membrane protein (DUF485 family)